MSATERLLKQVLCGFVIFCLVAPLPVWSGSSSLGTVRGVRGAKLSIDGGKTWLAVTGAGLPLLEGARLRAAGGGAALDLVDGSRVDVLPFTALKIQAAERMTEISMSYGRLTFRLPADARVKILTPSARIEPVRDRAMAGEVFVGGSVLMGLKMTEGSMQVRPLGDERQPILASLEPVFLPKPPATTGAFFSTDPLPPAPVDAKGVFAPNGESIGYLGPDGKLVISPGFTNDLTRPFSPKLVQLAMARIAEKNRNDAATPLFDVNGSYVGYLSGPIFYAEATQPSAAASEGTPARGLSGATGAIGAIGAIGAGSVAGLGLGIAVGGGAPGRPHDPPPSTPHCPPNNPHCR